MKRTNGLMPGITDPENLRLAFWKARKGKNASVQVLQYRAKLHDNLLDLREQLLTGSVNVGKYHYFKVYEPKERQICAAAFDEQVLHHALMNVCHHVFERRHIFDSYASRPGKGTHAALACAKVFCRRYGWYLKLDVKKFFASIHHEVLKRQLHRLFKEKKLLEVFGLIIDSYEAEPNRGLPIGNLTSQYFANHYLVGLDRHIKERMQMPAYVRYMDDMVLWHHDKAALKHAKKEISAFVEENLRCSLKPDQLNRVQNGLPFLGYRVFAHHTRLLQKSKRRFIKKMNRADERLYTGEWDLDTYLRHIRPLINFTQYADAHAFRTDLLKNLHG